VPILTEEFGTVKIACSREFKRGKAKKCLLGFLEGRSPSFNTPPPLLIKEMGIKGVKLIATNRGCRKCGSCAIIISEK